MSEDWGMVLKQFRLRQGLNQMQLAALLDVSQRTVSRWERSQDRPNLAAQMRIRDLGFAPSPPLLASLRIAIDHCPVPRALSEKHGLTLLRLSKPAIAKRPSMVNLIGEALIDRATGILQAMLDDSTLQKGIHRKEIMCVVATTRSVLRSPECDTIGTYQTTISYFVHDGTLYSDAISVPVRDEVPLGYNAVPA